MKGIRSVLQKYFKSNQYSSFRKQFNVYNFNREKQNKYEIHFSHPLFTRDSTEQWCQITPLNKKKRFNQLAGYEKKMTEYQELKLKIENMKRLKEKNEKKANNMVNIILDLSSQIDLVNMNFQLRQKENLFALLSFVLKKQPGLFQSLRQFLQRIYLEKSDKDNQTGNIAQVKEAIPFFSKVLSENDFMNEKFCRYMVDLIYRPVSSQSISHSKDGGKSNFYSDELMAQFDSDSNGNNNIMSDSSKRKDMMQYMNSRDSKDYQTKMNSHPSTEPLNNKKNRSESKNV